VLGNNLPVYLCPSDPDQGDGPRSDNADTYGLTLGVTSYFACLGANWGGDPGGQGWNSQGGDVDPRWINPSAGISPVTFEGLWGSDGAFFGYDFYAFGDSRRGYSLLAIKDGTSNTFMVGEALIGACRWNAWPYGNGTLRTAAIAPNATRLDGTAYDQWDWYNCFGFSSNHVHGVQFVYCDASVHFIHDGISLNVYRAMATRAGNEPLHADD
jgi:hypothetical protein